MPRDLNEGLIAAAEIGDQASVVSMLARGADPKAGDSWALCSAAEEGHLEVVKLLLPLSNLHVRNGLALELASANGHCEVARLLLPESFCAASYTALKLAVDNGHRKVIDLILQNQVTIGHLALQVAAREGDAEMIRLLLPHSDVEAILADTDFIHGSGCDLLLTCLPRPRASEFVESHPRLDLPRARAMLAAYSLRQRPTPARCQKARRRT